MADLTQIIRDELVAFAWDDFGLDDVECAPSTEWADNLAELVRAALEVAGFTVADGGEDR